MELIIWKLIVLNVDKQSKEIDDPDIVEEIKNGNTVISYREEKHGLDIIF